MGHCYNSTVVNAPIEKVWAAVRDFYDLGWAKGVIEKVDVVGSKRSEEIGARRILNGAFHETLLGLNDRERCLQYQITDGPGPVSKDAVRDYIGTVRLHPVTAENHTFVEWASEYSSAEDSAVGELCNPIYRALLSALRDHFS